MKSNDLRQSFIKYFEGHDHQHVPSSRTIPDNDPTILFTNAGMNQFKNVFLGIEERPYKRAVSSQKCVRAGGKHNDLENVGFTARHHTFFEMLGNFSFGDYFKKEAIHYAWDYLTNTLGIPKDKLYVTAFDDDDEAAEIWEKQEKIPKDRIYRFGEKDNFWRMGNTGPCGPCSEIFYDLGPEVGGDPAQNVMGGEGDRYMEIWNLVFMQFNEDESGKQNPLPNPSIDTGAGLERLAVVMQKELNNYHTDSFQEMINTASQLSGKNYDKKQTQSEINVAMRVLADHARTTAFLVGDGVLPSNEGRGYVLRRIMRRAIRYGRTLSTKDGLFPAVIDTVIQVMGGFYKELEERKEEILSTAKDEEKKFLHCLDHGTEILAQELKKLKSNNSKSVSGETAFKLYDTYGFPLDLTRLMAEEKGFIVDETEFNEHMKKAKELAKASWKGASISADDKHLIKSSQDILKKSGPTEFKGYNGVTQSDGKILILSDGKETKQSLMEGDSGFVIFDSTCFYGESGGQVGDAGQIEGPSGHAEVLDCTKKNDVFIHHIKVTEGRLETDQACSQKVDSSSRRNTAGNHSATHLLHSALRTVLGKSASQAGSLVDPDRLRFDFTHKKPMTTEEIKRVESLVNSEISKANQVSTDVMAPEDAIGKGALALFGEKYGDKIRVVTMGDFSMELCGGTHVDNTAMIRLFKIVSESGVSSGIRRLEAITGDAAIQYVMKHTQENEQARHNIGIGSNWADYLQKDSDTVSEWADKAKSEVKKLKQELQKVKGNQIDLNQFISDGKDFAINGTNGKFVTATIDSEDRKLLSDVTDKLKNKVQTGLVIVFGKGSKSHPIIVSVSKDLSKQLHAGNILKEVAATMGGKGGGRPDFAQGAGQDHSKVSEAIKVAQGFLNS